MKPDDRQKLFDRLMLGAAVACKGDATTLKLFEESTTEDLDAIEPLIDEIIEREAEQEAARQMDVWLTDHLDIKAVHVAQIAATLLSGRRYPSKDGPPPDSLAMLEQEKRIAIMEASDLLQKAGASSQVTRPAVSTACGK